MLHRGYAARHAVSVCTLSAASMFSTTLLQYACSNLGHCFCRSLISHLFCSCTRVGPHTCCSIGLHGAVNTDEDGKERLFCSGSAVCFNHNSIPTTPLALPNNLLPGKRLQVGCQLSRMCCSRVHQVQQQEQARAAACRRLQRQQLMCPCWRLCGWGQ